MRAVYESYSDIESQRAWCFNLYNRQRFHVASAAWSLSFSAWPVIISLDRRLLETAGGMPAATIAERRAETELVCKRFPALAALPLDRNSCDTRPLQPRLRYQVSRYVYNRLRSLYRFAHPGKNVKCERRYYVRIYDFNNPGWLAIRRQAEPYREKLFHLFDKDVLDKLLPAPDVRISSADSIIDTSGLKTLLGLMLWSKDHL
jgi:asparagine synthase (glutamine-hydrolysing)